MDVLVSYPGIGNCCFPPVILDMGKSKSGPNKDVPVNDSATRFFFYTGSSLQLFIHNAVWRL